MPLPLPYMSLLTSFHSLLLYNRPFFSSLSHPAQAALPANTRPILPSRPFTGWRSFLLALHSWDPPLGFASHVASGACALHEPQETSPEIYSFTTAITTIISWGPFQANLSQLDFLDPPYTG